MPWPVTFYRLRGGREPADLFINSLPGADQANYIDRLAEFGPALPFPSSSQVQGELRELRPDMGNTHYRILYRRTGNIFVLLHAFVKRGAKIGKGDIDTAQSRWADLEARMNEDPRTGPRPIGRDAR
jgi:phage-related protein